MLKKSVSLAKEPETPREGAGKQQRGREEGGKGRERLRTGDLSIGVRQSEERGTFE